jgi:hypothetical protein
MLASTTGHGQCTAWTQLLIDVLDDQGISGTDTRIDPPSGRAKFAVILMPAQGSGGVNYTPGTFANGGFNFHQVVLINGDIYDPSYGGFTAQTDARSAKLKYEDLYMTDYFNGDGTHVADVKGTKELIF